MDRKGFQVCVPKSQDGAVLVMALLMLVILSIMGAFALTISSVEQRVTMNSEVFQNNFYAAEAVTLEGAAMITETDDEDLLDFGGADYPTWLGEDHDGSNGFTALLRQSNQWRKAGGVAGFPVPEDTDMNVDPINILPAGYNSDGTAAGDRIWYSAVDNGVCFMSSITDPTREERCYDVFGMYDVKRGAGKTYSGRLMLNVGYKKVVYK